MEEVLDTALPAGHLVFQLVGLWHWLQSAQTFQAARKWGQWGIVNYTLGAHEICVGK